MVSGLLLIAMMFIPNDMKPISDGTSRAVTLSRNAASCCERVEESEEEVEEIIATETDATPTDATPSDATETDATETDAEPEPEIEILECYQEDITTEEYIEEYIEPEVEEAPEETVESPEGMTYIGTYYITGYVATGNPCANGNYPTEGYTIASNSLPMGTTVYIDGLGTRTVEDTGAMSGGVIDVYVGSVDEAYAITGSYEVYIYE